MAAGTLSFTGINMTAGQVLRIDTEYKTATVNGTNILDKLDAAPVWFTLEQGNNDIETTGDDITDTATVKVVYRARWL